MGKFALAVIVACLASSGTFASQLPENYPTRPVRLIVPLPPGGGTDLLARTIAQNLTGIWEQPVVVDNRAGAGGTIGVDLAVKAAPDGHTVVMGYIAPISVNVTLLKLPYHPVRDLAPISLVAIAQMVLATHPSVPARSIRDFVDFLKSTPKPLSYASGGIGSSPHLSGELFKSMTGVSLIHVPYKGGGPALVDLISGQVALYFASLPPALPLFKTGKIRALAVSGASRSALVPDLPTVAESGLPGFESIQWYGILAPVKTAGPIQQKIYQSVVTAAQATDTKNRLLAQGFEIIASTPREFAAYIKSDISKWAKVIKEAGIRGE